jgi:hypothetical protein
MWRRYSLRSTPVESGDWRDCMISEGWIRELAEWT